MFWLGGFLALEVTTSTPDALCPPLAEARAAIQARVGEVRGAYHVEFALVRAADGRQVLELRVREGQQQVLERELPLDDAGCQDAAQAIALVLERYFDAVENPPAPASNLEPIPQKSDAEPSRNSPPASASAPARDRPVTRSGTPASRAVRVRAGFGYDLELGFAPTLGVGLFPAAFRVSPRFQVGVTLDVAPFLEPLTQQVRAEEISAFTLQGALSVPLLVSFASWSTSIGPWAQVRLQRAKAPTLLHDQPAYRAVPGFGGFAQLGWSPRRTWTLGLGVALGAQAADASSRFVLRQADSAVSPVLVPESTFGQAQLTLALEL
jgi:hypothetical protein